MQIEAEKLRALTVWVADCANSYSGEYPIDLTERALASNVQAALKELGFEVSVADAAAIWESYSRLLQAGWMLGAETVDSARETLLMYCVEAAAAVGRWEGLGAGGVGDLPIPSDGRVAAGCDAGRVDKMATENQAALSALGFAPKFHKYAAGAWHRTGASILADWRLVFEESRSIVAAGGTFFYVDPKADSMAPVDIQALRDLYSVPKTDK